jgi:putative flippase GtrA
MPAQNVQFLERAWKFRHTPEFSRLWKYSVVSVVSTVVSLGGLALFYGVLQLASAAWCNLMATAIATLPSYYLNRTWAWGKSGKSHLMKEVVPFWTVAVLSALISTGVVRLAELWAHHMTHSHTKITIIVEAANFATYGALWIGKFVLFNKLLFKHHNVVIALDDDEMTEVDAPVSVGTELI